MKVYEIIDLVKQYPNQRTRANDGISFNIESGEIFGILGDNGAGKSTLVKQMVNLLRSTSGEILLFQRPLQNDPLHVPMHVGYMPQDSAALNQLTIREALYFTAHLRGFSRYDAKQERNRLLDLWGLRPFQNQNHEKLSGGQKRLFRLAVASAGQPSVLILDEPTNDLDPQKRQLVWRILGELNQQFGTTIIFITHDAIEAEKVIQRVGIMKDGKLVANGRPADLKKALNQKLRLELMIPDEKFPTLPSHLESHQTSTGQWTIWLDRTEVASLFNLLNFDDIEDFKLVSTTLEDLYIHYATQT